MGNGLLSQSFTSSEILTNKAFECYLGNNQVFQTPPRITL